VAKPITDKDPTVFKVFKIFKILEEAMLDDKENIIERVRGIYCFKVTNTQGKEGMWIIDAKNGKGSITFYGTGIIKIEFIIYKVIKWLYPMIIYRNIIHNSGYNCSL